MSRDNWTTTDEANFQALQQRRNVVAASRRLRLEKAVGGLLRTVGGPFGTIECARLAEDLVCHAHEIRAALEPYDNGPGVEAVEVAAVASEDGTSGHVEIRPPSRTDWSELTRPNVAAPERPPAVADAMEVAAQGVREEVIDATQPGYKFTRTQESEAEQVQLRD